MSEKKKPSKGASEQEALETILPVAQEMPEAPIHRPRPVRIWRGPGALLYGHLVISPGGELTMMSADEIAALPADMLEPLE